MISGSKKNPPAGRGVAACVQGLVTSVTRERLAIAAGGSCGTNTPRKTPPSLGALLPSPLRVGEIIKARGLL